MLSSHLSDIHVIRSAYLFIFYRRFNLSDFTVMNAMDKSLIWKFCFVHWVFVLQCFDCCFSAQ